MTPIAVVVDDHPMCRQATRMALEAARPGIVVREAANFAEALEQAERATLMTLDLALPDSHGALSVPDLLQCHAALRLLVISGTTNPGGRAPCLGSRGARFRVQGRVDHDDGGRVTRRHRRGPLILVRARPSRGQRVRAAAGADRRAAAHAPGDGRRAVEQADRRNHGQGARQGGPGQARRPQPNPAELEQVLGGGQVDVLLAAFARELRSRPAIIRECARRADHGSVRREAHLFRGAALGIGALASASPAAQLEHAPDDAIADMFHRFGRVVEQSLDALGRVRRAASARSPSRHLAEVA